MRAPFRISGQEFTHAEVVVVELMDGEHCGRGEACGVYYKADTAERMLADIAAILPEIRNGIDRDRLQRALPACGARHALDAALWELEASRAKRPAWQLAGLPATRSLLTYFTIGIDTPEAMATAANGMRHARAIKLKLDGRWSDAARVQAVRAARPDIRLAVDGNQGFTPNDFSALLPVLLQADVELVEQPLPRTRDHDMADLPRRIPIAADESVQDTADLGRLAGLFDVVNIKLDKCGGLTHALAMEQEARRLGFRVMVGNMTGTSWSQAPAFVLGQRCDIIDLDGPTFLASDRSPAVRYADGLVHCPDNVWGAPYMTTQTG